MALGATGGLERGVVTAPDEHAPGPIADYGLLSDCHSVALVSRTGSIDWHCTPRVDSPPVFGRLLDVERGGNCVIAPTGEIVDRSRRYLDRTMVLETVLTTERGSLRIHDLLAMRRGGRDRPRRQLVRIAECADGEVEVDVLVAARFDFGMIPPWLRAHDDGWFTLVGGNTGLAIWSDAPLEIEDRHDLRGRRTLRAGQSICLSVTNHPPERLDDGPPDDDGPEVRARLDETVEWWRRWCDERDGDRDGDGRMLRSALVLKSLVHAPTGAIAAAATTSLPEIPGGTWNWDYRFSWIRDSWMTVRSLAEAGFREEADGFHRFVERSSAGSAEELQLLYGVDGRHRTPEVELEEVAGYDGARPVRSGNAAQGQLQLDMYGYLLMLSWQRLRRGAELDDWFWNFLVELVDVVCERWNDPDHGIWELRGDPAHYTYSKITCWAAVDRGLALAEELGRSDGVDRERWSATRDEIRSAVESRGVCRDRGAFVGALDGRDLDAALLLVPEFGFVDETDERMVATVDAVIAELDDDGLIRRFRHSDESTTEGAFVACTFWLVERLVGLGRRDEAQRYFDRAMETANDLGLFAEEYDTRRREQLGNFPQALSHLAHIGAAVMLDGREHHAVG
jgi:GH15 family glucan-1,4-alpha-glucosidase